MQTETLLEQKHVKAKLCLVGETGVGKTSLIRRYVTDKFEDRYIATVGTKITKKSIDVVWRDEQRTLDMTIWDIMGEKGFRTLLKEAYFHGAQGVIAICDLTRPDTLFDLSGWVNLALKQVGEVPFVFMGNKTDLTKEKMADEQDLAKLSAIHKSPYYLTSAKTGENVDNAFRSISKAIVAGYSGETG
jgi:small GTP-binding protein